MSYGTIMERSCVKLPKPLLAERAYRWCFLKSLAAHIIKVNVLLYVKPTFSYNEDEL